MLIVQYNVLNYPSYTTNLALFTNVTNSNELRQLIVQGKLEAALLNASMVLLYHLFIVSLYISGLFLSLYMYSILWAYIFV